MNRRVARAGSLLGAAAVGVVATVALGGRPATSAPPPAPAVTTAVVVRTDLTTTALTEGTLGYAPTNPVVNRMTGTYTWLPAPGATVTPGAPLYRVDQQPVILLAGATPAWRPMSLGMTDGADVGELETNLIALGAARGLFTTPTDHFGPATQAAVERWQAAVGVPGDGQVPLGTAVFLPGPVVVGAEQVAPGQTAAPGEEPFQVTTTQRIVTVPVTPNLPSVHRGEAVTITLPTAVTTPGTIVAIGPAPPGDSSNQGSSNGNGSSNSSTSSPPVAILTVLPDQPAVTGTGSGIAIEVTLATQSAVHVLAVPIAALLALAGGGYGLEVVGPAGGRHLVGVSTGVFTGSQVAVTGSGIGAGTRVVVAP